MTAPQPEHRVFRARSSVAGAGISPDGSCVVVADATGLALIEEDGRSLWEHHYLRHVGVRTSPVALGWTPAGDRVFTVHDGIVRELDAASGAAFGLPEPVAAVTDANTLEPSRDGRLVAIGTVRGAVLVLNRVSGTVRTLRGVDAVTALAWTGPNTIAVATAGNVKLWNAESGTLLRVLLARGGGIRALAFDQMRSWLAVARPGGVSLIEARSGDQVRVIDVDDPRGVAFSHSGTGLFVGTTSGILEFGADGAHRRDLPGEVVEPAQLAISRGGLLAVRIDSREVGVYEPPDSVPPPTRHREVSVARRWAQGMGRTVGRSSARRSDGELPVVRPEPDAFQGSTAFAWEPSGTGWYAVFDDRPFRISDSGTVWTSTETVRAVEMAVAPGGGTLAAADHSGTGVVHLIDTATGQVTRRLSAGQSPVFDPSGSSLVAATGPGERPDTLVVHDTADGREVVSRRVTGGIGRLAWSPDGQRLAAAANGRVVVWSASSWNRVDGPAPIPGAPVLARVAWSPDGRYLAVTPVAGAGAVVVYETSSWQVHRTFGDPGGLAWGPGLAWAPDSRLLLVPSGAEHAVVEMWDAVAGVMIRRLAPPGTSGEETPYTVAWAPDGQRVAVAYSNGRTVLFTLENGPVPPADPAPLPYPPDLLARLGGTCAQAGAEAPLSLLAGLLALTGDRADAVPGRLRPLLDRPAVRGLRALRWPVAARIGTVALLTCDLRGDDRYRRPSGHGRHELVAALRAVLTGAPVPPAAPDPPLTELGAALSEVDERTLSLLTILGPEAVEADPLLPVRLRRLRPGLSALTPRQRRLLGLRLTMTEGGPAEGRGIGDSRAGLSRHGGPAQLLLTQLALPEDVFRLRMARDELLYRTRRGRLTPGPRGTILLLDDTPGAFGQVGVTLRTCAHLLATTMIERGCPCALVRLGDPRAHRTLAGRADLVELWTASSVTPPDLDGVAAAVRTMRPRLTRELSGPPRIILLTHPHLSVLGMADLRAIRVHYPGRPPVGGRPPTPPGTAPAVPVRGAWTLAPEPEPRRLHRVLTEVLSDAAG